MSRNVRASLEELIKKADPAFRNQVKRDVDLLLRVPADSSASLIAVLQDRRMRRPVRLAACWALGQLGDKSAVRALLAAFDERDAELRREASKSLGFIRSKRAVRPLITALLEDKDAEKRELAAYALGLLCDNRAVEPLLTTLSNNSEESKVRAQAAESLAHIRDDRTVGPLIEALNDRSVEVRFWSAFALGEIGSPKALRELRRAAARDNAVLPGWWKVSKEASDAIKRIKAREHR